MPGQAGQLAMGNGNALADPRRTEALALQERLVDGGIGDTRNTGRMGGQFLKSLLLAVDAQSGQDGLRV